MITKAVLTSIAALTWRKSMKWSDTNLIWGRPLRSILAVFNKKLLPFSYGYLKSTDTVIIEQNLDRKLKKNKRF